MRTKKDALELIESLVRRCAIVVGIFLLYAVGFAAESPPERMTYQGFLVDANGTALGNATPANYTVIFRIYDASQGGNLLWSEQQVVTVDKGLFSVILGEGSQFQSEAHGALSAAFTGVTADVRWIGVTVVELGGNEIAPRLRLLTSPFAFLAANATSLSAGGGTFISKSGQNVSVSGDLRLSQDGTEVVIFPRASEVIIGNSRDVPTRVSGQLNISVGARTIGINPNDNGHTRFTGSTVGGYLFDGRLNTQENGKWAEFQPLAGTMSMSTSANHWTFRDEAGKSMIIDPNDGGHTRFYNSEGGFIFNGFLNVRDRDNAGLWAEFVPQADHLRIQTGETRFVLMQGDGKEITIDPDEGGHPRFKAGIGQEWIFHGRNITAFRGSKWAIMEPDDNGETKFHTNDDGFKFIDDDNGDFRIDPKNVGDDRSTIYTSSTGFNFANPTRKWFIRHDSDAIIFAQVNSPAPWRFADHDVRVDKDIFARGSQINSDRRLKKNIETIEETVLDRVSKLRPVRFHWKDDSDDVEKTVGFIAQEVQELFPDAISENGDRLAISSAEIAAYTIAGLQEHKAQSDEKMANLQAENADLKEQMRLLLGRIQNLESAIQ